MRYTAWQAARQAALGLHLGEVLGLVLGGVLGLLLGNELGGVLNEETRAGAGSSTWSTGWASC
jgi:hypothetical protein